MRAAAWDGMERTQAAAAARSGGRPRRRGSTWSGPQRQRLSPADAGCGADCTGIQSAIDAAAQGDTVLVRPGEYVVG